MMLIMEEAMHGWGAGSTWEISVPSSQFCYKLKTALEKVKTLKKEINRGR